MKFESSKARWITSFFKVSLLSRQFTRLLFHIILFTFFQHRKWEKVYLDPCSSSSSFISIANLIICKTVCLEHFTYNKYFLFAFHIKYFCCIDEKIFFLECILHIACSESFPIERTNLN